VDLALTMPGMINYAWRLVVTGGCFLAFSVSGLIFSAILFPALNAFPGSAERRHARVKWLIRRFFMLLVAVLRFTGVMRLETSGVERLRGASAVLVLANHPSLIDVVVLLSLMPRATCVVKGGLWGNPVFAGVVSAAGYIKNDTTPEQLLEDCERELEAGNAVIIFPEGTRSRPNEPLKFLRGAAHVALKSGRPIVPVLLHCNPPTMTKGSRWYHIPPEPFRFRVTVRRDLRAETLADLGHPPVIAARRLTSALEGYFSEALRAP
jgi:1-acyl-sn-glycerol-3-phosphate acyltransferase